MGLDLVGPEDLINSGNKPLQDSGKEEKGKGLNLVSPEDLQSGVKPASFGLGTTSEFDPGKYDFQTRTGIDNNEYAYKRQSVGELLLKGAGRLALTTGTKFMEGVGYLASAPSALVNQDITQMTNNWWSEMWSETEEHIKEDLLPIYQSKNVTEGNLWDHAKSLSFWMNDGIDGASFFLYALSTGGGLSALGLGGKLLGGLNQLGKVGKISNKLLGRSVVFGKNATKNANFGVATGVQTVSEAAFEAKGIQDRVYQELLNQGVSKEEAKARSAESALNNFTANVGILIGPNLIMNKMVFGKFKGDRAAFKNVTDDASNLLKAPKLLSTGQKFASAGKELTKGILSEGFWEEASQFASEEHFFKLATEEGYDKGLVEGLTSEYYNALTTTDGQKAIMLGAVLGGLGGGVGAIGKANAENKSTERLHTLLGNHIQDYSDSLGEAFIKDKEGNTVYDKKTGKPKIDHAKVKMMVMSNLGTRGYDAMKDFAISRGDQEQYNKIKEVLFTKFAHTFIKEEGGLDVLNAQIDMLAEKEAEEITSFEDKKDIEVLKTELKQKAKKIRDAYERLDDYEGGMISLDIPTEGHGAYLNTFRSDLVFAQLTNNQQQEFNRDRITALKQEALLLSVKELTTQEKKRLEEINTTIDKYEKEQKELEKEYEELTEEKSVQKKFDDYVSRAAGINKKIEDKVKKDIEEGVSPESIVLDRSATDVASKLANNEELTEEDREFHEANTELVKNKIKELSTETVTKKDLEDKGKKGNLTSTEFAKLKVFGANQEQQKLEITTYLINLSEQDLIDGLVMEIEDNTYDRNFTPVGEHFYRGAEVSIKIKHTNKLTGKVQELGYLPSYDNYVRKDGTLVSAEELSTMGDFSASQLDTLIRDRENSRLFYEYVNKLRQGKPLTLTGKELVDLGVSMNSSAGALNIDTNLTPLNEVEGLQNSLGLTDNKLIVIDRSRGETIHYNNMSGVFLGKVGASLLKKAKKKSGYKDELTASSLLENTPKGLYRYVAVMLQKDGSKPTYIALTPRTLESTELDSLFNALNMFSSAAKSSEGGISTKVSDDAAQAIKDMVFVAHDYHLTELGITPNGGFKFKSKSRDTGESTEVIVDDVSNVDDLIKAFNIKLKGSGIVLNRDSFRKSIPTDPSSTQVLDMQKDLLSAVGKNALKGKNVLFNFPENYKVVKAPVEKETTEELKEESSQVKANEFTTDSNSKELTTLQKELSDWKEANPGKRNPKLERKIKQLKTKLDKKNLKKGNDEDLGALKLGTEIPSELIDIKEATSYLKSILPDNINIADINSILSNLHVSGIPFGYFSGNTIYLSENASTGTEYHEAFHAVFRTLLTGKEVNKYLEAAKRERGSATTGEINKLRNLTPAYAKLNRVQLEALVYEEYMADKFEGYKKTNNAPTGFFKKLFNKIKNWIKFISGNRSELEMLFDSIDQGKFRTKQLVNEGNSIYLRPSELEVYKLIPKGKQKFVVGGEEQLFDVPSTVQESKVIINTVSAKLFQIKNNPEHPWHYLRQSEQIDNILKSQYDKYNSDQVYDRLAELSDAAYDIAMKKQEGLLYMYSEPDARKVIAKEVEKNLKLFSFKEDELDNLFDEQEDGSEGYTERFDQEAWMIGGFGSLSKELRAYIGFATYEEFDDLTGQMEERAVDSGIVYNGIEQTLSSVDEENMLRRLQQYSEYNPQVKAFYDKLVKDLDIQESASDKLIPTKQLNLYSMFVTGFKKESVDYITTLIDSGSGLFKSFHSNLKEAKQVQVQRWAEAFSQIKDKKSTIKPLVDAISIMSDVDKVTEQELREQVDEVKELLLEAGITLSSGYIKYSILSEKYIGVDEQGNIKKHDNRLTEEQKIYYDTFSDIHPLSVTMLNTVKEIISNGNDPFISEKDKSGKDTGAVGRMLKVANGNVPFDETVVNPNHQNADGKTVYNKIKGSYTIETVRKLRDKAERDKKKQDPYLANNPLLNHVHADEVFSNMKVALADGIREQNLTVVEEETELAGKETKEGITFKNFDSRSLLLMSYSLFLEQSILVVKGKRLGKLARFNIGQNEASSTAYLIEAPVEEYYTPEGVTGKAVDIMVNFFMNEYNRIKRADKDTKIVGYNDTPAGRGFKLWNFAWLTEHEELYTSIMDSAKVKESLSENILNELRGLIKQRLENEIQVHKEILAETGILTPNLKDFQIPIGSKQNKTGAYNTKYDGNLNHFIGDFYMNHFINTYAINDILDGDPAIGRKNAVDFVKRNKSRMASGSHLGEGSHRVGYIEEPLAYIHNGTAESATEEELDEIETLRGDPEGLKNYLKEKGISEIKSADAQSWNTVEHKILQLKRWGKFNTNVEAIYKKIQEGESLTWRETQTLIENDAALNSAKTVTAGPAMGQTTHTGVYHKLSEFTLTREFTSYKDGQGNWKAIKGREFYHNLLNSMYKQGVDQVIAPSGSKLATLPSAPYDGNNFNFSGSSWDVENKYKRLQVETPTNKVEITAGTQLIQLIDNEQNNATLVSVNGVETTVEEVKNAYQKFLGQIRENSVRDAVRFLFDANDNPQYKLLGEKLIKSLEESGADDTLLEFFSLKADGTPKYNYNLPHVVDKFEQLFLAHFSKGVLSQKTPGYKLSLVSSANLNVIRNKDTGEVITTKEYLSNPDKYNTEQYITSKLKSNEAIIPAHFKEVFNLKAGEEIPDFIAKMLGYRIPTQDKHSMLSLKMVDTAPAYYGSVGFFSDQIVYLSGADFDIDSLFIQRKAFYVDKKTRKPIQYGQATTEQGKFEEYVQNLFDNNKDFAKKVKAKKELSDEFNEYKINLKELRSLGKEQTTETEILKARASVIKERLDNLNKALKNQPLQKKLDFKSVEIQAEDIEEQRESTEDVLGALNEMKSEWFDNYKETISKPISEISGWMELLEGIIIWQTLQELQLPSSVEEFTKQTKRYGELNNSIINNNILDNQIALLTNDSQKKIAATPATMTALEDEAKFIASISGIDPDAQENARDLHSINGLYYSHKNNVTGKNNIAPAANGNLITGLLTKAGVELSKDAYKLNIDGFEYNGFKEWLNKEDDRKMDFLSTILSAMTDNAKERLASKLNLTSDILKTVIYMTALGVPKRQVMLMVNQPVIKEYAKRLEQANSSIKSKADSKNRFVVKEELLKEYEFPSEEALTTELLEQNISKATQEMSITTLKAFLALEAQADQFFKVANLIKTNKGLGKEFGEVQKVLDTVTELGLDNLVDRIETKANKKTWQPLKKSVSFDIREALLSNHLLTNLQAVKKVPGWSALFYIPETNMFKKASSFIDNNIREAIKDRRSIVREMKRDMLAYLSIKGYKRSLELSNKPADKAKLNSLSAKVIIPELGNTAAVQLLRMKSHKDPTISKNLFIQYLEAVPAKHSKNAVGYDVVAGRQRVKESNQTISDLFDSAKELWFKDETRPFIIDLFNYAILKDNLRFKQGSFVKYIAPYLFQDVSKVLSQTNKDMISKSEAFGVDYADLINEFSEQYFRYYKNIDKSPDLKLDKSSKVFSQKDSVITIDRFNIPEGLNEKAHDKALSENNKDMLQDFEETEDKKFVFPLYVTRGGGYDFTSGDRIPKTLWKLIEVNGRQDVIKDNVGTIASYELTQTIGIPGIMAHGFSIKELEALTKVVRNKIPAETLEEFEQGHDLGEVGPYDAGLEQDDVDLGEDAPQFKRRESDIVKRLKASGGVSQRYGNLYITKYGYKKASDAIALIRKDYPGSITVEKVGFGKDGRIIQKITVNPQLGLQFQKESTETNTISKEQLDKIASVLSARTGVAYEIVTEEQALELLKEITTEQFSKDTVPHAFYHNNKVIFIGDKFEADTPFHEFAHPFIDYIEKNNKALFKNLKKQLQSSENGKSIIARVNELYNNLDQVGKDKEAIVTALGEMAAGRLDAKEDFSLIKALNRLLERISEYLGKILNLDIRPEALKANTSLQDLADMLAFGEGQILIQSDPNTVGYVFKAVTALQSEKVRNYDKDKADGFYNDLVKQGVNKEQIQLIKDYIATKNLDKVDKFDLITGLMSEMSYVVEIETTKNIANIFNKIDGFDTSHVDTNNLQMEETDRVGRYLIVDNNGNYLSRVEYSKEEAEEILVNVGVRNTAIYANLTVPGGTNYTENDIRTPDITPSIKGHAQFSSGQGIGWFRSDNQAVGGKYTTHEKQDAEDIHFDDEGTPTTTDTEGQTTKTRRILEVQSDLFQKGRDKENLAIGVAEEFQDEAGYDGKQTGEITDEDIISDKRNQFLQLLNKDNNWVTFFVKSIIQDSAKKGYEKVLFPKGDTASKIEGHSTLEEYKKQKEERLNFLLEEQKKLAVNNKAAFDDFKFGDESISLSMAEFYTKSIIKRGNNEINQIKQELERVEGPEGFGALKPIWKFYEETINNILIKQGYSPKVITDEYNNQWNEVELRVEDALSPIQFKKKVSGEKVSLGNKEIKVQSTNLEALKKGDKTISLRSPDKPADVLKKPVTANQKLVQKIKVQLQTRIEDLTKSETANQKGKLLRLETMQEALKGANGYNEIVSFIEDAHEQLVGKEDEKGKLSGYSARMDELSEKFKEAETDEEIREALDVLQRYYSYSWDFGILDDIKRDFITDVKQAIKPEKGSPQEKLDEAIRAKEWIEKKYINEVMPLLARKYSRLGSTKINKDAQDRYDKKTKFYQDKIDNAVQRGDQKGITKYTKKLAREQEIYDRTFVDEAGLIKQFQEIGRDTDLVAYLFDPLSSSSDTLSAIFVKSIKNSFRELKEYLREFSIDAFKELEEFREASGRNTDNVKKFNEGLYEIVEIAKKDKEIGKWKLVKEAHFTKEFDTTAYETSKYEMYNNAQSLLEKNEITEKEYSKIVAKWFSENHVAKPKAERDAIIAEMKANRKMGIITEDIYTSWYNSNVVVNKYTGEIDYRRELSQPNPAKFVNPNWKKLNDNKALKKYYDFLWKTHQMSDARHPESQRLGHRLPSNRKDSWDRISESGVVDAAKDFISDSFQAKGTDRQDYGATDYAGRKSSKINPVMLTQPIDVNDISLDLFSSVLEYEKVSKQFETVGRVASESNAMLTLFKERDARGGVLKTDSKGAKTLQIAAKKLGFDKYMTQSGVSNLTKHLEAFMDMNLYGEMKEVEEMFGFRVDKITDTAMTYMSFSTIGGDVLKAAANSMQARIQTAIESFSGEFYNRSDLGWGRRMYNKNIISILSDYNKPVSMSLIGQMIEKYDILQGAFMDRFGKNTTASSFKRLFRPGSWFFMQHAGEHEAHTSMMLAVMKATKVMVGGVETNLFDAHEIGEDGKLKLKEGAVWSKEQDNEFNNRLSAISKRLHGVYNKFDQGVVKRYSIGRLATMWRNFMIPMLKKRYKEYGADQELGALTEGFYRSFTRNVLQDFNDLYKALLTSEEHNLSPLEVANAKRALAEMAYVMLFTIAAGAMIAGSGDDDSYAYQFAKYEAVRLKSELLFFIPIAGTEDALRILKSPTAANTTIMRLSKAFSQTIGYDFDEYEWRITQDYKRDSGIFKKGTNKSKAAWLKLFGLSGTNVNPDIATDNLLKMSL